LNQVQTKTKLALMLLIRKPIGKKKRIPLTPLIDVIFILVMFFLLSSTFGIWRPLEVSLGGDGGPPAGDQATIQKIPAVLIMVRKGLGPGTMRLSVNGQDLDLLALADELDRLAARGAEDAILVPVGGTEFQQVVRILDMARSSKIKKVSLQLN
jgi:biopolymer transport protein ExbD